MRKLLKIALLLALSTLATVVLPAGALPPGTEGYNQGQSGVAGTCTGGTGNSLVYIGALKLWPPNHKYNLTPAVVATGGPGETIQLTTTGTHNQYEGDAASGSGNTADDIVLNDEQAQLTDDSTDQKVAALETGTASVTTGWKARAERSGVVQEGREYTITGKAEFSDGGTCSGTWEIHVPHDMRPSRR